MFDASKPFAIVTGDSNAKYEQGGVYYDAQGHKVSIEEEAPETESDIFAELAEIKAELVALRTEIDELKSVKPVMVDEKPADDLEKTDWRKIKEMVIEAGGEWNNKADGITFLRSL